MAVSHRTTVYRKNIAAMFRPSGEGGRWIRALAFDMKLLATSTAPSRTLTLARSHRVDFERGANQYQATAILSNTAEHAEYVHFGTAGHGGEVMPLAAGGPGVNTVSPYAGQAFPKKALRYVRGQNANPWLENACVKLARGAGAVGG